MATTKQDLLAAIRSALTAVGLPASHFVEGATDLDPVISGLVDYLNANYSTGGGGGGTLTDGDYGDITIGSTGTTLTIDPGAVTYSKIQDVATDRILGRDTAGSGSPEELTIGGGLEFTGSGGLQRSALSGDITASAGSNSTTITSSAVTNSKLATMPASTIKGNNTGATAAAADLTTSQVKTLLAISTSDVSGLATVATTGSAADLGSGTLDATRLPAFTGDVTTSAGSSATTIASDSVTNAKLANMAASTFKGNNTGSPADPADLTVAQAKTLLAITTSDVSGLATVATSGSASDLSGTLAAARLPAFTGDITTSAGSSATTLTNDSVTNAKLANMAANTLKGNNTGASTDPTDLTTTQVKTLLAIAASDVSGLAAVAISGSATDLSAGTLSASRLPAFTGDVTTSAGSSATTVANDSVTNAKLANMAASTLKGNNSGVSGDPIDLTTAQVKALLAIAASDVSGLATVATTGSAANVSGLAAVATTGSASDLGSGTLSTARLPALTGDVNTSAGSGTTTIPNNTVTYAKMQDVSATSRLLGRITAGAGDTEELTGTQATTLLDTFTSLLKGLVPASGGGTTNFLRADATWAAPGGGGGGGGTTITTGTATLNFGSFPGSSHATVDVTGQTTISGTSSVKCWLDPVATADHTADEHVVESLRVAIGAITPGVGFTIHGRNTNQRREPLADQRRGYTVGAAALPSPDIAPYVGGSSPQIYGTWTVRWEWY